MFFVTGLESPPEWGIVGAVVMALTGTFVWWVKAARQDLKESHSKFIDHLTTTGERQTEAIVASSVATQQSVQALRDLSALVNRHDEKATHRWQESEDAADARANTIIDHIEGKK